MVEIYRGCFFGRATSTFELVWNVNARVYNCTMLCVWWQYPIFGMFVSMRYAKVGAEWVAAARR